MTGAEQKNTRATSFSTQFGAAALKELRAGIVALRPDADKSVTALFDLADNLQRMETDFNNRYRPIGAGSDLKNNLRGQDHAQALREFKSHAADIIAVDRALGEKIVRIAQNTISPSRTRQ